MASPVIALSIAVHVVALPALLLFPGHWLLIGSAVVLDHAILLYGSLWPRSRLLGPNLRRVETASPTVALTFDDGPDPVTTPRVLDLLAEREVTATFFCIGRHAKRHPRLMADIAAAGHHVENHSYGHLKTFCFLGPRRMATEVRRAQAVLLNTTGVSPTYFRAPAGLRNPWLEGVLSREKLRLVSWTRRGFDTVSKDPERIVRRLTRNIGSGDVLVLHDGNSARTSGGEPVILEALPLLLDELQRRRFEVAAIPRCPAGAAGEDD